MGSNTQETNFVGYVSSYNFGGSGVTPQSGGSQGAPQGASYGGISYYA